MWAITENKSDDGYYQHLTLTDPQGRSVLSIQICTMEQDANEYSIDKERLLAALNREVGT